MTSARCSFMRLGVLLGAFVAAASLASCSSGPAKRDTPNVGPCPPAHVLGDAGRLVEFNGPEAYESVGFTAEVGQVRSACRYVGADPIDMELQIDLAFGRGPAAKDDSHVYNYWVAVTRRDIAVLAKEHYSIKVDFPKGANRMADDRTYRARLDPSVQRRHIRRQFRGSGGF
jgi:hypothetical protein